MRPNPDREIEIRLFPKFEVLQDSSSYSGTATLALVFFKGFNKTVFDIQHQPICI